MRFEWDRRKARANLEKHGVDLADAVPVFEDELALHRQDPYSSSEDRFVAMGTDAEGRVLVVIYVHRGETIRLISARLAEPRERRQYENEP